MRTNLDRVVLTSPSLLSLATASADSGAPRSWIQVAKTGEFVSNRYGKFSITKDDLKQMLHNFTEVTPKAPTELPIDYDHLSMDPQKPGDGIAAGWIKISISCAKAASARRVTSSALTVPIGCCTTSSG